MNTRLRRLAALFAIVTACFAAAPGTSSVQPSTDTAWGAAANEDDTAWGTPPSDDPEPEADAEPAAPARTADTAWG